MIIKTVGIRAIYTLCIISFLFTFLLDAKNKEDKKNTRSRKQSEQTKNDIKKIKETKKLNSELTYEELKQKKDELLAFGNIDMAVKIIDQMLRLCPNTDTETALFLELADLLYTNAKFEKALSMYKNFIIRYEGHPKFEYALFKSIQCCGFLLLDFDRDQTQTEEALALAEKYLSLPHCVAHRSEVEKIKNDCIARLFSSEIYTIEFYAKMGKIPVAQSHLVYVKNEMSFKALHNYNEEINRLETICLVKNEEEMLKSDIPLSYPDSRMNIYNEIF